MRRRNFIVNASKASVGLVTLPNIVPSRVIGKNPPSDNIQIVQIGYGRIARGLDTKSFLKRSDVKIIGLCDVDSNRMLDGKNTIEQYYKDNSSGIKLKTSGDYRELINDNEVDAVVISTPDHWHAQPAIEAAYLGKDFFLQKPTTLTIEEGKNLVRAVRENKIVSQICTQHRCSEQFRKAAELVRNGRIGKLETVYIGIGGELPGPEFPEQNIPSNLNYDMWLGSTPWVYYTEEGVHPQNGYGRPGWMKRHQFGAGGISNTGQHYIDVAAWGMNTERTGPISVEGMGLFPSSGLFDVPKDFMVILEYENGLRSILGHKYPSGVRYEGSEGWISAGPGNMKVTSSDPDKGVPSKIIDASDTNILNSEISVNEINLPKVNSLHDNWIDCIRTREQTIVPAEIAHRSCSVALLGDIAMHLKRKLTYNPIKEEFVNDHEANESLSRSQRYPYGIEYLRR